MKHRPLLNPKINRIAQSVTGLVVLGIHSSPDNCIDGLFFLVLQIRRSTRQFETVLGIGQLFRSYGEVHFLCCLRC